MMFKKDFWIGILTGLCMIFFGSDSFGGEPPQKEYKKPSLWQRTKTYAGSTRIGRYASGVKQRVSTRLGTIKTLYGKDDEEKLDRISQLGDQLLALEDEFYKKETPECIKNDIERTYSLIQEDIEALKVSRRGAPGALKSLLAETAKSLVISKEVLAAAAAGVCFFGYRNNREAIGQRAAKTASGVANTVQKYTPEPVKKYVVRPLQKRVVRKYNQILGRTGWEGKPVAPKFTDTDIELMIAAAEKGGYELPWEGGFLNTSYIRLPGALKAYNKLEKISFSKLDSEQLGFLTRAVSYVLKWNGVEITPIQVLEELKYISHSENGKIDIVNLLSKFIKKTIPNGDLTNLTNRIIRIAVMFGFK